MSETEPGSPVLRAVELHKRFVEGRGAGGRGVGFGADAEHGHGVAHAGELVQRFAAYTLGG